jgi:hypothetical protein
MNAKELIERLSALKNDVVEVPSPIGPLYMRRRTGEDRWRFIEFQKEIEKQGKSQLPPAIVVALSLCDQHGTPMEDEEMASLAKLLGSKLLDRDLMKLYAKALEMMTLNENAIEEAEKKASEQTTTPSSGTSSSESSEGAQ